MSDTLNPNPRVSPRYVTDQKGTAVRPHRVFDTHKREAIIVTADPVIARTMCDEYERQWQLSGRWRRSVKRLRRWLRSLWATPEPAPAPPKPTERERRVLFVENLCEKARKL